MQGRCGDRRYRHLAYVDSLSAISDDAYRYTDEEQHPGAVAAFRRSIATVAALPCDVLLTPHPGVSNMFARITTQPGAPLVDANACHALAAQAAEKLDERIAKEHGNPRQGRPQKKTRRPTRAKRRVLKRSVD